MKLDRCYLCGADSAHLIHNGVRGGETSMFSNVIIADWFG